MIECQHYWRSDTENTNIDVWGLAGARYPHLFYKLKKSTRSCELNFRVKIFLSTHHTVRISLRWQIVNLLKTITLEDQATNIAAKKRYLCSRADVTGSFRRLGKMSSWLKILFSPFLRHLLNVEFPFPTKASCTSYPKFWWIYSWSYNIKLQPYLNIIIIFSCPQTAL